MRMFSKGSRRLLLQLLINTAPKIFRCVIKSTQWQEEGTRRMICLVRLIMKSDMLYCRGQDTFSVTADDVILTDIRDNAEGKLIFLILIQVNGEVLRASDLQQAVKVSYGGLKY